GDPGLDPLPPADRPIIAKALSKKPADRWENCTAMVQALRKSNERVTAEVVFPNTGEARELRSVPDRSSRGDSISPQIKPAGTMRVDDYFELGPITQVASQRGPLGVITQTRRTAPKPVNLPEDDATSGVLRPVLMIGLGQFGRATVQWVRQSLQLHYGPTGLPIIRPIAVDTDPAPPSPHLARVNEQEDLLLTRLNRPARYIRSRDSLPPVEDWLNTNILYRMPRTQLTSGIRSLGRLALVEHYSTFCSRVERDLKAIVEPQTLVDAEKLSRESFLSRKPRVYVVGHLGGGTASGMFIDVAYIVKSLLRKHQFDENDIHAVFYVPDQECMDIADLPEANAVAALTELFHYQQAGMPFRALYESKSEWKEESTPPFTQIQFVETPPRPASTQEKSDKARLQVQRVAEALVRTMITPLGRIADPQKLTAGTTPYQAIGLRVLNSPRRVLIRKASHLVFQNLLEKWLQPAHAQIQQTVRHRIDGFFHFERYSPESLQHYFEQTIDQSMEKPGDQYISALIAPFQHGIQARIPNVDEIKRALREIIRNLGSSGESSATKTLTLVDGNTKLFRAIREGCEKLVRTGATRLVYTIYRHMDKAGLRFCATEEALRYTLARLD
ncbi:MAG TPA: tubulin-like doman-containing protein, partial [Gemmatales bacterium]|nr:tubulin-like doman-containing protein [Gemmatales bacterium]